jgi:hypothetical protein
LDKQFNLLVPFLIPTGMKLGWDLKRNLNKRLIAWKSDDDPTPGDFSWGVVLNPYPDIYMMKEEKSTTDLDHGTACVLVVGQI